MARFNIPKKDGFLCVGVITQAHSLKGEVLVKSLLDDSDLIEKGLILTTVEDKTLKVNAVRSSNKGLLIKFAEIHNRNDAEKARKTYLYLSHEEFPQEEDDEIYYFELKEYEILDDANNFLGNVVDAFDNGANTVLEVKLARSDKFGQGASGLTKSGVTGEIPPQSLIPASINAGNSPL